MALMTSIRDTTVGQLLLRFGLVTTAQHPEDSPDSKGPSFSTLSEDPAILERQQSKISIDGNKLTEKATPGTIVVTWYNDGDEANPRNWSSLKKGWVMTVITLYTFVVYCTASIITPTVEVVMQRYHLSYESASLGLAMYVFGYATGPMFFSPLSEVRFIGRNPPYVLSFVVFFALSIALCFADNWPGIVILRFLQGWFGSPALATGAASIEDMYDMYEAPYGYVWWVAAMYCGPALGPLLAGYAISSEWRWPMYEVVIMSAPVLVMLPLMPETWPAKILLRRAERLRKSTGNDNYRAASELKTIDFGKTLASAMIKPIEISLKDPAIGFAVIYCMIVYGTYYSFFEAFPITYLGVYQMSLGGLGLIFTSLAIGCGVGVLMYVLYLRQVFIPRARHFHETNGIPVAQEQWLRPGLVGVWGVSAGLILYAWTARRDIHWMVPTLGIGIWAATSFLVFQSMICYVALTYPKYVASLFAANDFCRSSAAGAMVLSTRYMVSLACSSAISRISRTAQLTSHTVHQLGHRQGCQCGCWHIWGRRHWHVLALLVRRQAESPQQVFW
jgi:MFS transporter, DHA1 family, multidrug resistance protein